MNTTSKRYAAAASRFTALVDSMPDDAWDLATPCEGWSARDVLEHVVSTEADFLRQRDLSAPDTEGVDARSAWPVVRDAVQQALDDETTADRAFDGYFGPTTIGATIDRFYTVDLLVHRWDIATAAGLGEPAVLDVDEIALVRSNLSEIPDEVMRMPGLFGPAIEPSADADDTTVLMSFLGREA